MGRRRKSNDSALNLDSLLDTLTNVIGFLLILLALMKISVGDAVERIREANPEAFGVSESDIVRVEKRQATLAEALAELEEKRKAFAEEVKLLEVARGGTGQEDEGVAKVTGRQAEATLARLKGQKQALDREEIITESEIKRLKDRLAKLPTLQQLPGKKIRLPDPRPAPEGMGAQWVFCKNGRVAGVNHGEIQKEVREKMNNRRVKPQIAFSMGGKDENGKEKDAVFDQDKSRNYFDRNPLLTRDLSVKLKTFDTRTTANMLLDLRARGGETAEKLKEEDSRFRQLLKDAKANNRYLRFMVYPDSFEAYLEARSLAMEMDVLAGWQILTRDEWETGLGNSVQFRRKKEPPPPSPRPATTNTQPRPPAPKPKVID